MAYKFKPNKSVAKRFKVSKTGKLKRHHGNTSHLMSSRSADKRRGLRQPAIVPEVHARRLRKLMGVSKSPGKVAAARLAAKKRAQLASAAATAEQPAAKVTA